MNCIIHWLGGRGEREAVFVYAGYSVCEQDQCLDAVGDTLHDTIMAARKLD